MHFYNKEVSVPSTVPLAYFQLNHQRVSDLIPKIFSLFMHTSTQRNTHKHTHTYTNIQSDPNLEKKTIDIIFIGIVHTKKI